jgi:hypothetical protein
VVRVVVEILEVEAVVLEVYSLALDSYLTQIQFTQLLSVLVVREAVLLLVVMVEILFFHLLPQ